MGGGFKTVYDFVMDLLFPPRCAGCDTIIPIGKGEICPECREAFSSRDYKVFCVSCRDEGHLCGCAQLALCAAPFHYGGAIRSLLHAFKFDGKRTLYSSLAAAMADSVKMLDCGQFDVICDVPLSRKRIRERGFNQSEDLAKEVAEILNCEYEPLLAKTKDNPAQHTLPAAERRKNVQGVYAALVGAEIEGKTILLCDDILTTGATLSECVRTLQKAGAKRVFCAASAATSAALQPEMNGRRVKRLSFNGRLRMYDRDLLERR